MLSDSEKAQLVGLGECYLHTHPKEVLNFEDRLNLMVATPVNRINSNYQINQFDEVILVDTTAGNVTIQLPLSAFGREFRVIKLVAANSVIIAATAPETINGAASVSLTAAYQSAHIKAIENEYILL